MRIYMKPLVLLPCEDTLKKRERCPPSFVKDALFIGGVVKIVKNQSTKNSAVLSDMF